MSSIILHENDFAGEAQRTINARELHAGLGIVRDFPTWFKDQIKARNLIENKDYIVFHGQVENPLGGRPRTEYFLTIRAAKHITAMSRTPGGEEYREALFNLEDEVSTHRLITVAPMAEAISLVEGWTRLAELFEAPKHLALIEASKQVKLLGIDTTPLLQSSSAMDDIRSSEIMLEPTAMASVLGFKSGIEMNKVLERIGLQSRIGGQWVATDMAEGMYFKHAWEKGGKSGYNYKWNVSKIEELLGHMLSESE